MANNTPRRSKKRAGSGRFLSTERTIVGGTIVFTLAFLVIIVISGFQNAPPSIDLASIADNSTAVPIQGRDHIPDGAVHPPYNSNPPTSGWHYVEDSRLGVFTTQIADETLVHNLEHGHVWLSYRDADDQDAIDALTRIQRAYPNHVIVTYRPENDTRIAAAAWGRLLTLDALAEDELHGFVQRYRERAPENIPG
ncbi:MAG: DUF3105 domain-containing protein [Anaerolineae bacterium]|nr:DUF3105 domain-containing protein [Anaerolineae bacterium]